MYNSLLEFAIANQYNTRWDVNLGLVCVGCGATGWDESERETFDDFNVPFEHTESCPVGKLIKEATEKSQ